MSGSERLGIGVMIRMLGSNKKTVEAIRNSMDKEIVALELRKGNDDEYRYPSDKLLFAFADDTRMEVWDGGQSCCEERYMHTDDELQDFVGSILADVEVRGAPDVEDEYGEFHEVQFLVVTTSKGAFTIETHNEHNGYYGGFYIEAAIVE